MHSLRYCPICDRDQPVQVVSRHETLPVLGEPVPIDARVAVCRVCGESVPDRALDEATLQQAYAVYRMRHGIASDAPLSGRRALAH